MGQGRRHFTDEFKQEAIALVVSSGRPLSQIASELGISPSMLRNWRNGSGGRDAGSVLRPIPASAPHPVPDPAAEISPLRAAKDLQGSTTKWVKGVEDLNIPITRAQGIVGVGAIIPISTASCRVAGHLQTGPAGSAAAPASYCSDRVGSAESRVPLVA
jgi:transposase